MSNYSNPTDEVAGYIEGQLNDLVDHATMDRINEEIEDFLPVWVAAWSGETYEYVQVAGSAVRSDSDHQGLIAPYEIRDEDDNPVRVAVGFLDNMGRRKRQYVDTFLTFALACKYAQKWVNKNGISASVVNGLGNSCEGFDPEE